ncbi:saposin-related [Anaeramoeba flamelloides]|uniref:Saposin-related n=1 Tax=Anaeramoeba flamelloides TaxID=1746091 RepID=A0ABQ8X522_9EUKA|nr:saposin-related [Anaeramoeba flamelloides]
MKSLSIIFFVFVLLVVTPGFAKPQHRLREGKKKHMCKPCQFFIVLGEEYLENENPTVEEFKQYLFDQCATIEDGFKGKCEEIVENKGDQLYEWLSNNPGTEAEICEKLEICKRQNHKDRKPDKCHMCHHLARGVVKFLENEPEATDEQIEEFLTEICERAPEDHKEECLEKTKEAGFAIVEWIKAEKDPKEFCFENELCKQEEEKNLKNEKEDDHKNRPKPDECQMCHHLVRGVVKFLENEPEATDEQITEFLAEICERAPEDHKEECLEKTKEAGFAIVEWIKAEKDPKEFCLENELCKQEEEKNLKNEKEDDHKNRPKPDECQMCHHLVRGVVKFLENEPEATDEQIEEFLTEICERAPEDHKEECLEKTKEAGFAIVEWIKAEKDPKEFCFENELCKQEEEKNLKNEKEDDHKHKHKDHQCQMCHHLVMAVADFLLNEPEATDEQIEEFLAGLCEKVPEEHQEECLEKTKEAGFAVVEWIKAEKDPKEFCFENELCKQEEEKNLKNEKEDDHKNRPKPDECQMCHHLVRGVVKFLENEPEATDEQITEFLAEICERAPEDHKEECLEKTKEAGFAIVEWIKAEKDPKEFCFENELCKQEEEKNLKNEKEDDHKNRPKPDECHMCHHLARGVVKFLENEPEATDEQITEFLAEICERAPEDHKEECLEKTKEAGFAIVEWIKAGKDPKEYCLDNGFCEEQN